MIIPDRKKAVSVILSKMGSDGSEKLGSVKPEDEIDAGDGALKAIADDMLMAFDSRSAHDLVQALKAFLVCVEQEDSEHDSELG